MDLEVKKQNQAPSNRNRKEQEPSNMAFIESNGLGLFSSFGESVPEEQIPYDELLRKRKKKRNGKGLDYKSAPNNQSLKCKTLKSMNL